MKSVVIVDDHPMMIAGLKTMLEGSDYRIVGQATGGHEALSLIEELHPEVVILDVHMAQGGGIELMRELQQRESRSAMVFLTAGVDELTLAEMMAAGVSGIVLKSGDPALLLECLDEVVAGQRWIAQELQDKWEAGRASREAGTGEKLSPRELQIVDQVRQGMRNQDIAATLGVTEGTVKVYLHNIFVKTGVRNRTELAMRSSDPKVT